MAATKISPAEAQSRLRKAAKLAASARRHGISANEIANDENARRAVLAYAGYLARGASVETWKAVLILLTEGNPS